MKRETFIQRVELPVSADEAFAYHERPGALDRLIPPWENVSIADRGDGIRDGSRVVLVNRIGPVPVKWVAEHLDYQPGRQFRDIQRSGPFRFWDHTHRFEPQGDHRCVLEDHIEYVPRGGAVGRAVTGGLIRGKLTSMFAYRHRITAEDLALQAKHRDRGTLHVAITGSRGLVGGAIVPLLTTGGHRVTRIVRGAADSDQEVAWDPAHQSFDASPLEGIDAVVHLAGENIAVRRWTTAHKQRVRDSRLDGTRLLCEQLARMDSPPKILVSASGVGFYGDRGDEWLDEESSPGEGFLADVAREWEAALEPAVAAGIRVVKLRFGMVLTPRGGALASMLMPFRMGVGGKVGNGRQYMSWIDLNDAAGVIYHALMCEELTGPVNAVAPEPITNADFTKVLGRVLSRPTVLPVPAAAAKLGLGEMAEALLLASTRVKPRRLLETGYTYRQPDLEEALRNMLGRLR